MEADTGWTSEAGMYKLPGLKGEDRGLGAWRNPTDPGWIMEHRDFLELWLLQITFAA